MKSAICVGTKVVSFCVTAVSMCNSCQQASYSERKHTANEDSGLSSAIRSVFLANAQQCGRKYTWRIPYPLTWSDRCICRGTASNNSRRLQILQIASVRDWFKLGNYLLLRSREWGLRIPLSWAHCGGENTAYQDDLLSVATVSSWYQLWEKLRRAPLLQATVPDTSLACGPPLRTLLTRRPSSCCIQRKRCCQRKRRIGGRNDVR